MKRNTKRMMCCDCGNIVDTEQEHCGVCGCACFDELVGDDES
jgi:hypothetical protein